MTHTLSVRTFPKLLTLVFVALATMLSVSGAAHAGDGEVLHVGEATSLYLDGSGWALDKAASRGANLVSVQKAGASGASQRYVVRGLKTGQAELVFRNGSKTYHANIDVLK